MTTKPSIFSSPSRYVQGKNAIHELGTYLKQLGTNPLLLADDTVWGLIEDQLTDGFKQEDLPVNRVQFEGFATAKRVDDTVKLIKDNNYDVVVGIGALQLGEELGHQLLGESVAIVWRVEGDRGDAVSL